MSVDPHATHGTTTLSLAEKLPDGGIHYQSWDVCSCALPGLRDRLGEPHHETLATAAQVLATGRAVQSVPGAISTMEGI